MKIGDKHSLETREKMRKSRTARKISEEAKKKISNSHLGMKHSQETKDKLRLLNLGKKHPHNSPSKFKSGPEHPLWKGGITLTKDYAIFMAARRQIVKRGNGGTHSLGEWNTLKAQYNFTCPCCKKTEPNIKLTQDHVIPLSKGGSDNIENIQPLCGLCNSMKNTKTIKF